MFYSSWNVYLDKNNVFILTLKPNPLFVACLPLTDKTEDVVGKD